MGLSIIQTEKVAIRKKHRRWHDGERWNWREGSIAGYVFRYSDYDKKFGAVWYCGSEIILARDINEDDFYFTEIEKR